MPSTWQSTDDFINVLQLSFAQLTGALDQVTAMQGTVDNLFALVHGGGILATVDVQGSVRHLLPAGQQTAAYLRGDNTWQTLPAAGPTGPQGVKGDQGDPGPAGADSTVPGPRGETGLQGPAGMQGPQGLPGPAGLSGAAATIDVGATTTLPAGSDAAVVNVGSSSAGVFEFSIPRGSTGLKGDPGQAGSPGAAGATGPKGDQGIQGLPGSPGAAGAAATVAVGTTSTLPAGANATVTNTGSSAAAVFNFGIPRGLQGEPGTGGGDGGGVGPQGPPGEPGQPGQAATITTGPTTTLAAGSNATVTNTGSSSAAVFAFGIPQGVKGDAGTQGDPGAAGPAGAAASVAVGTTSTGNAGTNASVSNAGTSSAAVLNFTIPRGDTGAQGPAGTPGETGRLPLAGGTMTGALQFAFNANARIMGDMSNAPRANRLSVQSNTGVQTNFQILPPATGGIAAYITVYGGAQPDQSSYFQLAAYPGGTTGLTSAAFGSGVVQPITLVVGTIEGLKVLTDGSVVLYKNATAAMQAVTLQQMQAAIPQVVVVADEATAITQSTANPNNFYVWA